MKPDELKPCPFCNGNRLMVHSMPFNDANGVTHRAKGFHAFVTCVSCDIKGPTGKSETKAAAENSGRFKWNQRWPSPPRQPRPVRNRLDFLPVWGYKGSDGEKSIFVFKDVDTTFGTNWPKSQMADVEVAPTFETNKAGKVRQKICFRAPRWLIEKNQGTINIK